MPIVCLPARALDDVLHLIDCEKRFLAQASDVDAMKCVVDIVSMVFHTKTQTSFLENRLDAIHTKDSKDYPCLVCCSIVSLNSEGLRQGVVLFIYRVDHREDRLARVVATLVGMM